MTSFSDKDSDYLIPPNKTSESLADVIKSDKVKILNKRLGMNESETVESFQTEPSSFHINHHNAFTSDSSSSSEKLKVATALTFSPNKSDASHESPITEVSHPDLFSNRVQSNNIQLIENSTSDSELKDSAASLSPPHQSFSIISSPQRYNAKTNPTIINLDENSNSNSNSRSNSMKNYYNPKKPRLEENGDSNHDASDKSKSESPHHFNHKQPTIQTYFSTNSSSSSNPKPVVRSSTSTTKTSQINSNEIIQQLSQTKQDLLKENEILKQSKEHLDQKIAKNDYDLDLYKKNYKSAEERNARLMKSLEEVHRTTAFQEFRRKRDRLALDCVRLGKLTTIRTGPASIGEVWEDGYAIKEITKRNAELLERKEMLENRKKKITSLLRSKAKKKNNSNSSDDSEYDLDVDIELFIENEAVKVHLEQLKKDEISLGEERRLLESERAIHQKELKRSISEERSRFYRNLPCLSNRYILQCMLGKGGFSEVWKAIDLVELREVAVKIHQLDPQWDENRKNSYIKHVTREYYIHRELKHPRVVQLYDVFEIDINSFATVLEYCRGIDLDERLKRNRYFVEKDARMIFLQILSGLRYLSKPFDSNYLNNDSATPTSTISPHEEDEINHAPLQSLSSEKKKNRSIIHYDLKPANILFDEQGDVKITDFGLSKMMDNIDEGATSLELTTQGAGTYWYLPPECFAKNSKARITPKVDIWSAGVIFYQMLYGCRPFGEGRSQESVWTEDLIVNSGEVYFPTDSRYPKISEEAKEVIRACLTKDHRFRPDIFTLCNYPYLRKAFK